MVFVVRKINYFGTFAIDSLKLFLLPNFNLAFAVKMQSIDGWKAHKINYRKTKKFWKVFFCRRSTKLKRIG